MGDKIDVFIPLNQDTMDRHLHLLKAGACAIYDKDKITPGEAADGVQLCPMPMKELIKGNKLAINTAALGATLNLLGIESEPLEAVVARQFKKKGDAVVAENIAIARAGYDYAAQNFKAFSWKAPVGAKPLGVITGNQATAMGGAAAGVKFYAAYPMSPSTGVLMWMARTRPAARNHGSAGRGRDRRDEHGHRRGPCRLPVHVCDQRRRLCS